MVCLHLKKVGGRIIRWFNFTELGDVVLDMLRKLLLVIGWVIMIVSGVVMILGIMHNTPEIYRHIVLPMFTGIILVMMTMKNDSE